ncbi:MAG: DNA primase [Parcubacteria group bacterium]
MADKAVEQIKEKLDLVEFLRGYLELKPAGANFKANCPFHKEKTPSFMVSPDRQIWHCFGCNEGGDIFKFLMKYDNLEFYEALKLLAEKANIPLGRVSPSEQKEFGVLYDINRAATDYYRKCLVKNPVASEYLFSRKLSAGSIEEFEIGFSPNDFEGLAMHLMDLGFNVTDAARAGLIMKTERGKYIDRFRGRVMFPLESNFGKVIGFTGRVLPQFDTGDAGKYVNSPETPIFSKSRLLYGLSKSKEGIRETGEVLLVEGQMDVIMSHQDGVKNTVGTSGTALTEKQLSILKRYAGKLILNFDNDEAGKRAMERSIDLAQKEDFETRVLDLSNISETGGLKDPADVVAEKPGVLKEIVSRSIPAMEYYMARHPVSNRDIGTKKQSVRIILGKITNMPSVIDRAYWMRELALRSGLKETDLLLEAKSFGNSNSTPLHPAIKVLPAASKPSANLAGRRGLIAERLISLYFASPLAKSELERVKTYLPVEQLELYNAIVSDGSPQNESVQQKIAEFSLRSGLTVENIEREISELAEQLELEALMENRDALSAEMKSRSLSEEEKLGRIPALMEIVKRIETIKAKK